MAYIQHTDLLTGTQVTVQTPLGYLVKQSTIHTYNSLRRTTKDVEVVNYEMNLEKISRVVRNTDAYEVFKGYHLNVFSLGNPLAEHSFLRLLSLQNSENKIQVPGKYPLCADYKLYIVESTEQFEEVCKLDTESIYVDTETVGLRAFKGSVCMLQLGRINEGTLEIFLCPADVIQWKSLSEWFKGKSLIFHNLKFDLHQLVAQGVNMLHPSITLQDTMIMYRVFYSGLLTGSSGLTDILNGQYSISLDKRYQKLSFRRNSYTYDLLDYAACDIYALHIIHSNFVNFHKAVPYLNSVVDSFGFFYELQMETLRNVFKMEAKGISLDFSKLEPLADALHNLTQDHREVLVSYMGVGTNPNSPSQVMKTLMELSEGKVNILSTQAKELEPLLGNSKSPQALKDFIKSFLEYKKSGKLLSFVSSLAHEINPDTKKIHASFNHSGTSTGRFSCSAPNLQQIPRDSRMRELFVASPGCNLIVADYSQIELVIATQITQDETLLRSYREGTDVHKLTASKLLGKSLEEITKADRQLAKAVNFGLCLTAGHKVVTGQGLKNIEDMQIGDIVLTHKGNWKEVTDTQQLIANKVFRITTSTGKIVESTNEHMWRVLCPSANGRASRQTWVNTDELSTGDYLVFNTNEYVHSNENLPDGVARCLGWFIAEGSYSNSNFSIPQCTKANPDVVKKMDEILPSLGFKVRKDGTINRYYILSKDRKNLFDSLDYLIDFTLKAKDKTLGKALTKLSRKDKLEILAGLWDGDGCISYKAKETRIQISYSSISHQLLKDIQALLDSLGICSSIYIYPVNKASSLHINGISKKKFLELIPTVKCGRVKYESSRNYSAAEKIIKIEEIKGEQQVYDITVTDDHSFVANGLITHNCYGMGSKKLVGYAEASYGVTMSPDEAERFRHIFLNELYPGIAAWHKRSSEELSFYLCPPAVTLLGRCRLFRHPVLGRAMNGATFSAYVNAQDQGSGADMTALALMLLDKTLDKSKAYPVLQVHDEIVVESTEEYTETAKTLLGEAMEYAGELLVTDIPIVVEIGVGKSWAEAK